MSTLCLRRLSAAAQARRGPVSRSLLSASDAYYVACGRSPNHRHSHVTAGSSLVVRRAYTGASSAADLDSILGFQRHPISPATTTTTATAASSSSAATFELDGEHLDLATLVALGEQGSRIAVSASTVERLKRSRAVVDRIVASEVPSYGINTGFGLLSHTSVASADLTKLQNNLIRSHASGVGAPLEPRVVRRIMALRINTLARGRSGISLDTFERLVALFNSGCTPEVPSQGTVGASGDLAPLAHVALGLLGEGRIFDPNYGSNGSTNTTSSAGQQQGQYRPAAEVLAAYGLRPATFGAKDGLSLVNGTQFITGVGSVALEQGISCAKAAQPIAALSMLAMHGHTNAFDARVFASRPHVGSARVAEVMRCLVPPGSNSPTTKDVQDPYSIRCIPQTHGCVLESLAALRASLEIEMNSSTDNPLVFDEEYSASVLQLQQQQGDASSSAALPSVLSAGNFHGEYPAKALDTLALYVGELGRVSAARVLLLADPARSRGLPAFLAPRPGLNSGFMCWELTAAALDAENRTLSMPASAESALTGAGKEDHVSMGGFSARKAVQVVENTQRILAIELMLATHALQIRTAADPAFRMPEPMRALLSHTSALSPPMHDDRYLRRDFDALLGFIRDALPYRMDLVNPKTARAVTGNSNINSSSTSGGSRRHFSTTATTGNNNMKSSLPRAIPLPAPSAACRVHWARPLVDRYLSPRDLQTCIGQTPGFALNLAPSNSDSSSGSSGNTFEALAAAVRQREADAITTSTSTGARGSGGVLYVVDSSEDDFGSRANFGRGHDVKALAQGCPSSYESFARRLMNTAVNAYNAALAADVCVVGSIDSADLTAKCSGLCASVPAQRRALIDAVAAHNARLRDVIATTIHASRNSHRTSTTSSNSTSSTTTSRGPRGVYLVNGDHNHMASAIEGVIAGYNNSTVTTSSNSNATATAGTADTAGTATPVAVVYVDLHADSRPCQDGPHSGTWCSDALAKHQIEKAFVVGLNPMGNSGATLANLDAAGEGRVVYQPYMWDAIKCGDMSLERAGREIGAQLTALPPHVPVVLSICGDSVLHIPASAGTGTIGYSAADLYRFVAAVCSARHVDCFTVAELKTTLAPHAAGLVGEFLTQCLYVYHKYNK